jgi:uncharacterized protein (TIGR03067 family)
MQRQFALVAILSVPAAVLHADPAKKDLDKLQGTWVMAALDINGKTTPTDQFEGTTLTIKGDKYIVKVKDKTFEMHMQIDPGKTPKTIDMSYKDGPKQGQVHKGIYELEGDTFKICRGLNPEQERPIDFTTQPGSDLFVVTWKRENR